MTAEKDWNAERIDLVRRTVCPQGIPVPEFALFIEQCKRSGLDPLLKECFCVKRRQNIGTKEQPHWVDKYEFQPAETGMLRRAEEFPDFKGIMASAVYAGDDCEVDAGQGLVRHHYRPGAKRGALIGAWAKLVREGRAPLVIWLDFAAYVQRTATWDRMPATMMEKCSRVAALRKGYPGAFGGMYIPEELQRDEVETVGTEAGTLVPLSQQMAATAPKQSRTEALKGELRTKSLAAKSATLAVEIPAAKPSGLIIEVKPGQTEAEAEAAHKAAKPSKEPTPYESIQELGKAYGKTVKQMASIIKGATGKERPSQLDHDDVARVHDVLAVSKAQEENEPPPHTDDDVPFGE